MHNVSIKQTIPKPKTNCRKQDFIGQSLYFNHRVSFDTKGPISPPKKETQSNRVVIVDTFTDYVALNPVPHCNAYYE